MKRILLIASALMLTGTVASSEAEAARRPAVVVAAPPAAKVWVPAHRNWSVQLSRFITVHGQWQTPPRANVRWVPGHHVGKGHSRRWVPGHWSR
ncbi:MAG: hypothetical protein P8R54_20960 [Myxococcota bacterium]|nr:hypothetical protein [Myxococcota bacterium]